MNKTANQSHDLTTRLRDYKQMSEHFILFVTLKHYTDII